MQNSITPDLLVNRYLQGEHEAVWADLVSLGSGIRREPYLTPALAVCKETVRRSRENLITLIRRLDAIGFEFWSREVGLFRLSTAEVVEPWTQGNVWGHHKFEEANVFADTDKANMLFPLSVQLWAKEIGYVTFQGRHPRLCPFYDTETHPALYADPLMVALVFDTYDSQDLEGFEFASESLIVSWTDDYKSECSFYEQVPNSYNLKLPNPGADAKLEGEGIWHNVTFVEYLRKNFQWGGFPGWERYSNRPEKELAFLREGLLPI